MANTIKIKRRSSGSPGAPSSLKSGELAHNEVDDILYVGKGDDGSGNATSIGALAGTGAFVGLTGNQTVAGTKTFSNVPKSSEDASSATDLVRKSQHDLKANLASPNLTGTPTAPTAAADTNTTQIATTAFVLGQAGSSTPLGDGTATVGTSTRFARDDHRHPTDATRAPLASPALTGTPTAPTAANGTNTTQIATTAYVMAQRLDQHAVPTTTVDFNNQRIANVATPTQASDAANKDYVDNAVQGLSPKQSVKAATTANIASLSGALTVDGVSLIVGDRVLVKDQSTASANGIYLVQSGAWTRSPDANSWGELISAFTFVEQGTVNGDTGWVSTIDQGGTLGSTAVSFVQFTGAGQITAGAGLTKSGNTLDVGAGTGISVAADTVGLTGQALALHNLATNGIIARTGSGTVAGRSITTSGTGVSVSNGNGVSGNPTVSLSTALSTVGGLTPAADRLPYYTGASSAALATLTSFGRSLIDDADNTAARTTLGLGTIATQNANSVNITGGSVDNLTIDGGTF